MNIDRIVVCDTETSGFEAETASLLEVAWVVLQQTMAIDLSRKWEITDYRSHLVEFTGEIPPDAKGVHNIVEEMVAPGNGALPREQVIRELTEGETEGTVYCAHNIGFDRSFLKEVGSDDRWICTWRSALHLYPDAVSHKNLSLRYELKVEPSPALVEGLVSHRALYDAAITSAVLLKMLESNSPANLLDLSKRPVVLKTVRFGKHRGLKWSEVPRDYLSWMLRNGDFDDDTLHTARHYLDHTLVEA